jgi:amino acid permease
MAKKKSSGFSFNYEEDHHHKKHRTHHRISRTLYFVFVSIIFLLLFWAFSDNNLYAGLFIAYLFALGCFVIYELVISKYIKNHDLRMNSLHQAYIGLVALVAGFLTYLISVIFVMGLEDTLLLMTILTVTTLLLTVDKVDPYLEDLK